LLGFRGEALLGLMVLFASPTAVSSYTMAQQMGADGKLAGQLVAFTTGVSLLTIFLFVFLFKQLGYL
jgi:malate permease and related proteins